MLSRGKWLDAILVVALAAVLVLVYWQALSQEFGFHNDYRVRDVLDFSFDTSSPKGMLKHLESMHLLYVGRPINAIAFNFHQSLFHSIADFAAGRAATLALTIALAVALYMFLRLSLHVGRAEAFILSLATYCLPSFQLYINWVANFVPGTFNAAISVAAFHCAHIGWTRSSKWLSRANLVWVALAFLLLEIGLFNYPATALFILFYLFIFIAYSPESPARVATLSKRILGLTVAALASYFIIFKFVYFPWMEAYWGREFQSYDPGTYKFDLLPNENMLRFVGDLLRYGLLAWLPTNDKISFPLFNGTILILASLVWLCWPVAGKENESVETRAVEGEMRIRLMLLVALFSIVPFLVSPKSFVAYRVEAPWFAMFAVAISAGYLKIARMIGLFLGTRIAAAFIVAVATIIAASTWFNVSATVKNAVAELDYFRKRLADLPAVAQRKKADILVVLPPHQALFVEHPVLLDLAYTATNYSGLMYGIIHMIAEERGVSRDRYEWRQDVSPDKDMLAGADIVIDMRKLVLSTNSTAK